MSIILHPTAFSKDTRQSRTKFIPREESHDFVLELSAKARVRCVNWPKDVRIAPTKHGILSRTLEEVCGSDHLMPLTKTNSGSTEPQMIAEHREFLSDDTFQITRQNCEPVIISGRSVVHVGIGKSVAVNKLAAQGAFLALAHLGSKCEVQEFTIEPFRRSVKCITLSVWDQPYRVYHTNAYLMLEIGLLVG